MELDVPADGRPDAPGNQGQAEEEQENSPSTDQQTQEAEVRFICRLNIQIYMARCVSRYS